MQPDYRGGGIVNLMGSICASFDAPTSGYAPLAALSAQRLSAHGHVVLLVLDGLGYSYVEKRNRSTLRNHLWSSMSSVFPPTTAAAIPTFLTGFAPQQHGFTGWFTYLGELGCIAAVLPFTERGGAESSLRERGIGPRDLCGTSPVFERISAPCSVVMPEQIAYSEFNMAFSRGAGIKAFRTLDQMFSAITRIINTAPTRNYVYAYWPQFDSLAHKYGVASEEVERHFVSIDTAFTRFLDTLREPVTVIVTADHGFVDSGRDRLVEIGAHPNLARLLAMPLCGEPRAAYCYVQPGRRDEFTAYVRRRLEREVELLASCELIEREYFGLGQCHPRLQDRVGHYVMAMRANYMVKDWVTGERRHQHIGVHGGFSRDELLVPLIIAQV
ncbi:MAG: alkaline phosphatase family protein [Gammaproteobacteria bacterium]|nr:alkaline phosphatase family protein [Gammaproteobacteria bacterium]